MAVSKKVEETPIIPEVVEQLPKELVRIFQQYGVRLNRVLPKDQSEDLDTDPTTPLGAATKQYVDAAIAGAGSIPAGSRIYFDQDAAPTGWTRDVTLNDRMLRVVSGARADGGSWTLAGLTVGSHVLSIAEMPAHTHDIEGPGLAAQGAPGLRTPGANVGILTSSTGGGGGHVHGLTSDASWRPLHHDCIIAVKD